MTSAASTSATAWIWSSRAAVCSHLTFSAHSFAIQDAGTVARRINQSARCSSNGEPYAHVPALVDPGEFPSAPDDEPVRLVIIKREKGRTRLPFVEDERFRPRFTLRPKYTQRRPLWARIFFASKKVRSIILLNVLTVIYASDIPFLKEVEAVMEPASFNMVRFVVTTIPFLPFVLQEEGDHLIRSTGIELGFWVSCGYLSQAIGLITSEAGHASFISAFTVIIVPLVDGMFGARVPAFIWSGAFASLIGAALLECDGIVDGSACDAFSSVKVGDILNMLNAVFFGIHMLRTEHISRTTRKEKIMALLGYEVCTVALSSAIWFLLKNTFVNMRQWSMASCTLSIMWDWMSSFPWIPALYTGVFSTGLCLWAEMDAMNDISVTETAIIYGLEPVWGAAFAWFLLGERWGNTEWIGAILVLCGSLAVQILSSMSESCKDEISDNSKMPAKQNDLSFSTVIVNESKKLTDLVRKQDKLQ